MGAEEGMGVGVPRGEERARGGVRETRGGGGVTA